MKCLSEVVAVDPSILARVKKDIPIIQIHSFVMLKINLHFLF